MEPLNKNICTVAVHCWYIKDAFAGFCQQIILKNVRRHLRENWQKKQILAIKWVGGLHESVKKENLWQNLFQKMFNEVLKSCKKMISTDIKTDAKQEIKELCSTFSKREIQCKTGLYF